LPRSPAPPCVSYAPRHDGEQTFILDDELCGPVVEDLAASDADLKLVTNGRVDVLRVAAAAAATHQRLARVGTLLQSTPPRIDCLTSQSSQISDSAPGPVLPPGGPI